MGFNLLSVGEGGIKRPARGLLFAGSGYIVARMFWFTSPNWELVEELGGLDEQ